jgi:hypothetical protein
MSKLSLRIDKFLPSEGEGAPEAFARIQALDPSNGRNLTTGGMRQERVPISRHAGTARELDMAPGYYQVEAVLPSGEILTDTVEVKAGEKAELVLHSESSPNEWLGWQHLMGNVAGVVAAVRSKLDRPGEPTAPGAKTMTAPAKGAESKVAPEPAAAPAAARDTHGDAAPRPPPPPLAPRPQPAPGSGRAARPAPQGAPAPQASPAPEAAPASGAAPAPEANPVPAPEAAPAPPQPQPRATGSTRAVPHIAVQQPVHWLSKPLPDLANEQWATLLKRAPNPDEWVKVLNCGAAPRDIPPTMSDHSRAVFLMTHGSGTGSATALNSPLPRDFVIVRRVRTVELVSLPMPWYVVGTGREAGIELVVQQLARAEDFASSIAVRDERLGLLLGFLSSGALSAAQQIAEEAKEILYGKVQNPLAAAAGGYALVGSETDNSPKPWHEWTKNLMDWFPAMPDGAIQWATLLRRQGSAKSSAACAAFKAAARRGLPFYSLGLRWLLDGLERYASRDAEASELLPAVRATAARMHQQSPFTILRLGER